MRRRSARPPDEPPRVSRYGRGRRDRGPRRQAWSAGGRRRGPRRAAGGHGRIRHRRAGLCLPAVGQARHQGGGLRVQHRAGRPDQDAARILRDGQIVEEHAEFINPEHTATLALAKKFGLQAGQHRQVPAGDASGPGNYALSRAAMAPGRARPGVARLGLEALSSRRLRDGALAAAVQRQHRGWPPVRPHVGDRVDRPYIPGGVEHPTSVPCASRLCWTSTAARRTRCRRSTWCICSARTPAPPAAPSRTASRNWPARTRSGTFTAATTS